MGSVARAVTWSVGLWRLASGRIREDWRFLVGVWLLLACATTLLASGVLYGDAVAVGSLRAAIRAAPIAAQAILVETDLTPEQARAEDPPVRASLAAALGRPGGEVMQEARSGSLLPIGLKGSTTAPILTYLESATGASAHAALVAGRWARPGHEPLEATIAEPAARAMGLAIGDDLRLADAADPGADPNTPLATVLVVGTYTVDPTDPYWAGDGLDISGQATISGAAFRGPLLVDPTDLLAVGRFASLDVRWRAIPDLDRLTADEIEPLRARLDGVSDQVRSRFPLGGSLTVTADLGRVLDTVDRSLQVARGAVLLLTLQFAVVAVYAVLLIAGMLADRRRPEVGLLRSRGASTAHVVGLAFGEALLLATPAAIVAPFAAAALIHLLGLVGPLAASGAVSSTAISPTTVLAVAVTALLAVVALTLPALASGADLAGIRAVLGRPVARTLAQRLGIDLALVVVAALAIWQLRDYGAPLTRTAGGVLGLDPLLVAAPALGLVAGAVLATRVVPRLGEIGERVLGRGRGLVSPLGARQIARRPLRYTRAALLLMLSTALGTFGAAYAVSWSGSQADQAAYKVGADVRVEAASSTDLPDWAMGSAYRAVSGVTAAMPVAVQDLTVGQVVRGGGTLLALDAKTAAGIASLPPGPAGQALPPALESLAAARPTALGLPLPVGSRRLRVTYDADLTEAPISFPDGNGGTFTQELPPDYRGVTLQAVFRDADGRVASFAASDPNPGLFVGRGQTMMIDLPPASGPIAGSGPAEPLSLLGLDFSLAGGFPFAANPITGGLGVTGLAAATASGSTWTTFGEAAALDRWAWEAPTDGGFDGLGMGSSLSLGPESIQLLGPVGEDVRLRAPLSAAATIPAIASQAFLAATGSTVGQTITARSGGTALTLRIAASAVEFPTLDPATPFVIVDGPTLADLRYLEDGSTSAGADWWLSTSPGADQRVAATLAAPPFHSQTVLSRGGVAASLAGDPVGLGTLGALLLGSLAAAAFAVLGFLVGASVSVRERAAEFALLRALGLSGPQLAAWLTAEQAFLLGVGLLAGTGVGVLLAWLILPATLLSASGAPVVPPPTVVLPWALIGLAYLGAILLLAVTSLLVGRPVPRRGIAGVLRAAGE